MVMFDPEGAAGLDEGSLKCTTFEFIEFFFVVNRRFECISNMNVKATITNRGSISSHQHNCRQSEINLTFNVLFFS